MKLAATLDLEAQQERQEELKALEKRREELKEAEQRQREIESDPSERRRIRVHLKLDADSFILRGPATLPLGPRSTIEMWKVKVMVS
jgi:hypothetical protein